MTIPQSNPGNIKGAIAKLHGAAQLINEAIPQIPLGTPLHTEVLKIATNLNKHLGQAKEQVQDTIQEMIQAVQRMRQNPQMGALTQGAPPPNQPPAMPAPAASPPMAA